MTDDDAKPGPRFHDPTHPDYTEADQQVWEELAAAMEPKALPGGHMDAREAITEGAFSAEQIDAETEPTPTGEPRPGSRQHDKTTAWYSAEVARLRGLLVGESEAFARVLRERDDARALNEKLLDQRARLLLAAAEPEAREAPEPDEPWRTMEWPEVMALVEGAKPTVEPTPMGESDEDVEAWRTWAMGIIGGGARRCSDMRDKLEDLIYSPVGIPRPDPLPGSAIRWGAWKYSPASDPNNPNDEWVQARVMSGPNEGTVLDFVPDQIRCLAAVLSRTAPAPVAPSPTYVFARRGGRVGRDEDVGW